MQISILNLPNFCVSYYLQGLDSFANLVYKPNPEFSRFDFRPLMIFECQGKLVVIDNSDPVGLDEKLVARADYYFATNKLTDNLSYQSEKIYPLNPHFPVNISGLFLKTFWKRFASKDAKAVAKECYRIQKRPAFQVEKERLVEGNTIFFAGSIWKKEMEANQVRYSFIKYCKQNKRISFEGGFLPRGDGDNLGFEDALAPRTYSPKEFLEFSKKSIIGFNNAAVLGALSWRFAEYLNLGVPIVSLPFKVELKDFPIHGEQIHLIQTIEEIPDFLEFSLDNPSYLNKIAQGGKAYFKNLCVPTVQADMILKTIFASN